MSERKKGNFVLNEALEFLNHLLVENPVVPFVIPLILVGWVIEKWIFSFSNWVPLLVAVWATIQYGSYQRQILVDDLDSKWRQVILRTSPVTPLEHCEWLNKLLMEIWPNYMSPKLSMRFASIVEKRLKYRKPRLVETMELQEFSLGSCPPTLGLHGTRWSTEVDQLLLMPVLEGKAILYSFLSTPEVRIGVAFGSGGSQSLPATELPGVSSWLVKLFTDTLDKTMVEPRRQCHPLPFIELRKKAVAGIIYVTVISANKLSKCNLKGSPSRRQESSLIDGRLEECRDNNNLQTFVEAELEELTRRTSVGHGSSPKWDSTFNMSLHDDKGILKFNLYERNQGSVKYDYLTSCEIKIRYVADDSTVFWAIGPESRAIAKHVEFCGKEVEMVIPFEGINSGELTVKLLLKEWQFSDGSHSLTGDRLSSRQSIYGSANFLPRTGRKIYITVVEGKDLMVKDKFGKSEPYVKLQMGKVIQRTRSAPNTTNSLWNQKFEFHEIGGGEYLKIKCHSEETFKDDDIGSARLNLEGLIEGSMRDVWVPLEKVNSGELRFQIEAVRIHDNEGSRGSISSSNGWIELTLIEARDLVAADIRGTSDPYVKLQYGNTKRRTKVMYKTLNPRWHQTFEFPDDGSLLELHVKDHNAVLPTSSIGDCVVEYQRLPPNQPSDKWIPLQGVKKGEIHIQITRKVSQLEKRPSSESESPATKAHEISVQMKQLMTEFRSLVEDMNVDGLSASLSELQSLHDMQEEYLVQLETEKTLLLNNIAELGKEILNSSPALSRKSSTD
ncbi:uncharacterized protein LOC131297966 isoform X6 [Rhododendron vialii]|uniref:uncharacterized protein LOC131297966 isoform X6 n=1 Tax=Rhododendron vialii TaxID=182163 RepID=UPI00265DA57A|nr:uncharacterized protein LOC131297966 isoform X6 [Rhododendron vialii]